MLPELEQKRAILNVKTVLDGLGRCFPYSAAVVKFATQRKTCRRQKISRRKARKGISFYYSTRRSAQENERVGYVDILGKTDVAVPRMIVYVIYINTAFNIDKILPGRCEQWCYMYLSSLLTSDSTKYKTLLSV